MLIKELIDQSKKLGWDKMIYPLFSLWQKMLTIFLILLFVTALGYTIFCGIRDLKSLQFYIAVLGLFINLFGGIFIVMKMSDAKWKLLERRFQHTQRISSPVLSYDIYVDKIKSVFIRHDSLNREDIAFIINGLKYQGSIPSYRYKIFKFSYAIFFVILGMSLKSYNANQDMKFEDLWNNFLYYTLILGSLGLFIGIIERAVVRDFYMSWMKDKYNIELIRYLEEISLSIKKPATTE
ncbi:hypothetical protein SAMN05421820_101522 [Pedobacter steynii]|uniref:Uncharacterized protein n=1 Tax=Pedobacter steynii TaxID=430522 RepID=A0A1G9KAU1_9SPHI|nr:hypothetical protein [Pedobacter steynii]NQX38499.1 hypothetical protein [Pedobacter steynii]SDL46817.1 hypothetical protein SAMN05421820_101522 [Pedobacter steynii]